MSTGIETLAVAAVLLATGVAAIARNDQVGQSPWCWVSEHSDVAFCDYSSLVPASPSIAAKKSAPACKNNSFRQTSFSNSSRGQLNSANFQRCMERNDLRG